MADIFHEVDEEVRRERLQKLWDRYSIYIIALAVLIVAGIGAWRGYEWWQAKQAAAAGAQFEAALTLSEAGQARRGGSRLRQDRRRSARRLPPAGALARRRRTGAGQAGRRREGL